MLLVCAVFVGGIASGVTRARHAAADTTDAAALPWWWNGKVCDTGRDGASYATGASYLGVQVCAPQPYKYNGGNSFVIIEEGPDPAHVYGEGEWQCVELAMRFMTLIYGVTPYGANGDGVVDNYTPADGGGLVKYRNATPGVAPLPGDILSFSESGHLGHVGVIASSDVDTNGNGSVTMLSENDTDDGWRTLVVTNWVVSGFGRHYATGWLHDPAGRGWGADNPATANWGGITARPGGGYWAVTPNGLVTARGAPSFGDARALGMNAPIIDIAATHSGKGYWLLGADGGIFSYGDARFYGSTGAITLNKPIVAIAPTPTGHGYWLTASDGGIFSYGDARFYGGTSGRPLAHPIAGIARTTDGRGYWLVESDGLTVHAFGDASVF